MKLETMYWVRPLERYEIGPDQVRMTTQPGTDLWQRTYYHFANDNAPLLLMDSQEEFFSFSFKTDFSQAGHRFDQCGLVVYLDAHNWLKASVEYENQEFAHLGSVVTNFGYSDWATQEIPSSQKTMYYRLSRRGQDFRIEASLDGETYWQIRICHLHEADKKIAFGLYACSPEDSSFVAVFSDFALTPCVWEAHQGQAPDPDLM